MSSIQGVGQVKIVGAPTFPKWHAGAHTCRIPIAQAFRPEAFPSGGTVVAPGTKILAPNSRELQNLAIRQNSGHSKNVGAPTFLDSPRVVRS
jgi:hypothetical protein